MAVITILNPLCRSEEIIKEKMLRLLPVGMRMDDAITVIDENDGWVIFNIDYKNGYSVDRGYPSEAGFFDRDASSIVGEKYISVLIGEYRVIFVRSVVVFIGFDEESKLIDLHVRKDVDSL
jgi:hypothetical protein